MICSSATLRAAIPPRSEERGILEDFREHKEFGREVLLELKRRGQMVDLQLAIGDGALGF